MKKILLICLLASFSSLFGTTTVKDFFGKVKVKHDGDSTWSKLEIGQELMDNSTISTGFNSQVVLDLGNATLDVLPLTRMTISEITETQDTIATSLFLQGGKIKADVGKIEGKVNDFKVKSPVATASVRGTAFEFTGNTLTVIRGEVGFAPTKKEDKNPSGDAESTTDEESDDSGVSVKAGGNTSMSSPTALPVSPSVSARAGTTVVVSTKPAVIKEAIAEKSSGDGTQDETPSVPVVKTASVIVNVTLPEEEVEP